MKYLKRFEDIENPFKKGDYVKYISSINSFIPDDTPHYSLKKIKRGDIFTVTGSYGDVIEIDNTGPSNVYFSSKFILATPEEIKQYNLEKKADIYNI